MTVRITGCSNDKYWYRTLIGEDFNVHRRSVYRYYPAPTRNKYKAYQVDDKEIIFHGCFIHADDCDKTPDQIRLDREEFEREKNKGAE